MRTGRAERRRQARKERRDRVEELAGAMTAPEVPLVWGAGWRGKTTAAVICVLFVTLFEHPAGAGLAHPRPGALIQALWTSLVVSFPCCWFALWRVTADRDGVHVRRLWSTRLLPWSTITRVEMRRDGQLEFFGRTPELIAGLFAPPWLSRVVRSDRGSRAADTLSAMVLHGDLRPTARVERGPAGTGFAPWIILLGVVLYLAVEFLPHWRLV
ncbi:PH domain-containing protein [Streptomyces sp. 6-11-2]|uniref:PH domain-containing protein n=1 Tax=Streptomyces sp. 6-11-2 TaxID=2585753 RepID=UPI001143C546|nr:PH domain-containing protein [Streptomyces sp. 6-11-2]